MSDEELAYVQFCDGREASPGPANLRAEARGDRLYPGDGEFDLEGFLRALPRQLPISVEAPCAAYASLPIVERARLCGERTRAVLERFEKGSWGP